MNLPEFKASSINTDLIKLNFKSVTGQEAFDHLLYSDKLSRRNDGRLNAHTLNAYKHLEDGGWWVNGVDPETGQKRLWGQLKPNQPKVDKDGKIRKYEAPPKEPTEVVCLQVSRRIGLKVALKAGLLREYRELIRDQWIETEGIKYQDFLTQPDPGFWKWVKENTKVAIAPSEGVKKAASMLSRGVAALSIAGIWNGCSKDEEGNPQLDPYLKYFATPGREFVITFDQDDKLKTQANVLAARERLASCLREACCKVNFLTWDTSEKGIDDAITANGKDWFEEVWNDRGNLPSSIKISKIEQDLPIWKEKEISEWLADFYQDKLIFEQSTKEWYMYGFEREGVWSRIGIESLERTLMFKLDTLLKDADKINNQIYTAIKAINDSNRENKEKKELISQLKKQLVNYPSYKLRFVEDCRKRMSRILLVDEMICNSDSTMVPMGNGVLELSTRKLFPHKPQNYYTWALPYKYDPMAVAGPIYDWFVEMMDGDLSLVEVIRAYLHGVVTGRSDWQKYLELIGPGGTGKSTLIRLAIALVGFYNCHTTTLKRLEKSQFETASIKDKRLVLITDAEKYSGDITTLKALTGQDTLPYEKKREQSTGGFKPNCLVIMAGNEHIKTADYTSGLNRRRITIGMKKKIEGPQMRDLINHKNDGSVVGEFAPYLPGLLNWVLGIDPEEAKDCIDNADNRSVRLTLERIESMIENNPIAAWLNENIVYDPQAYTHVGLAVKSSDPEEVYLKKAELLYPNYCAFCEGSKVNPISIQRFSHLVVDFCCNQLNLSGIKKDSNRNGRYIHGLRIRTAADDAPRFVESLIELASTSSATKILASEMSSTSEPFVIFETLSGEDVKDCLYPWKTTAKIDCQSIPIPILDKIDFIPIPVSQLPSAYSSEMVETSSPIGDIEDVEDENSLTVSTDKKLNAITWEDAIAAIDRELKRIGWDTSKAQQYIVDKYQKHSRRLLNDSQLLEFLNYLQGYSAVQVSKC